MGRASVGSRIFLRRGECLVTAIVKGTFAIIPGKPLSLTDPSPLVIDEQRPAGAPASSSVTRASDFVPLLQHPEVVVVGDACAPSSGPRHGNPTTRLKVGLQLLRGGRTLLAKSLEVIGDRRGPPNQAPPEPRSFERLPIVYERAYGGLENLENPSGVGADLHPDGTVTRPNFVVLRGGVGGEGTFDRSIIPAGFGPISSLWPRRKRARGSASHRQATQQSFFEWTADLDPIYFQSAPADQQVKDFLPGDEIVLGGMHPHFEEIRCFLPEIRAFARGRTGDKESAPFSMRMDSLHLDVNAQLAEIVWRGAIAIDVEDAPRFELSGGLARPGEEVSSAGLRAPAEESSPRAAHGTLVIEVQDEPTAELEKAPNTVVLPVELPVERPPRRATMELAEVDGPLTLPFHGRASALDAETVSLGAEEARNRLAPLPPPGSPWAKATSEPIIPADLTAPVARTLVTELPRIEPPPRVETSDYVEPPPPLQVEPPSAPVEPRPVIEPPHAPNKKVVDKAVWRKDPEPDAHAARKVEVPRTEIHGQMYKKLRK